MRAAYFEGLVLHFHDQLLLLFLASAGLLELGLDAVDLHLVLHHCGGTQKEMTSCERRGGPNVSDKQEEANGEQRAAATRCTGEKQQTSWPCFLWLLSTRFLRTAASAVDPLPTAFKPSITQSFQHEFSLQAICYDKLASLRSLWRSSAKAPQDQMESGGSNQGSP